MDENIVTASPVYFGKNPPGELSPNGPTPVSLRHIVDVVSEDFLMWCVPVVCHPGLLSWCVTFVCYPVGLPWCVTLVCYPVGLPWCVTLVCYPGVLPLCVALACYPGVYTA